MFLTISINFLDTRFINLQTCKYYKFIIRNFTLKVCVLMIFSYDGYGVLEIRVSQWCRIRLFELGCVRCAYVMVLEIRVSQLNWGFLPIELFSCEFSVFHTMDIEGGGEWWWWGEVEVMVMLKAWAEGVGEVFILHSLSS